MDDKAFVYDVNTLNEVYNPVPPPDGVLYHYTDFAGLHGILESHNLRATYNRVLNDASQQVHAETVLHQEMARLGGNSAESGTERRHFVTCFCDSAKVLNMWRSYAGSHGGYCLGFDYTGLRGRMNWPESKVLPLLARVYYGNTPESIRRYLIACGTEPGLLAGSLPPFFPSMIKDIAFKEEHEWRIIALDPPVEVLKFRPGASNIRPYVELHCYLGSQICKLPLVSVHFGPMLGPGDRPEEIIGWMLEKNGYTGVAVGPSGIPFRL